MTDWSDAEKDKIWQSACDEHGKYQELTFEQFKALIIGEGGFHLKAKVEGMAATAQAAQIENTNEPVGQELVGLTRAIQSDASLPKLPPVAIGQFSDPLLPPSDAGDWESATEGSTATGLGALGKGDRSSSQPGDNTTASAHNLPLLQEHAKTMPSPSGFDVDPPDSHRDDRKFDRVRSSNSGRIGRGVWYGDFSDSDDEYDEDGKMQPKLLTKRRTGNNGGASPDLVRSTSEGGALKSPHAPHRRTPMGFSSNTPPVTPNELPSRGRNSPTAAVKASSSLNTSGVHFRDGRNGASPDSVAEHGISTSGKEISGSYHGGAGPSHTALPVCFQQTLALCFAAHELVLSPAVRNSCY